MSKVARTVRFVKLIAPETAGRRARAAVELAPYDRDELERRAEERGLRSSAFARIVAKKNPRGFKTIEELWALADACEVPRWFLEEGLEGEVAHITPISEGGAIEDPDNLVVVMAHLNERLSAIEGELGLRDVARASNQSLTAALDRAAAAGRPAARGTRGEADASEERDAAPARETPSSAEPPAR